MRQLMRNSITTLVLMSALVGPPVATATDGWAWYPQRQHFVHWSTPHRPPVLVSARGLAVWHRQKDRAIAHAKALNDRYAQLLIDRARRILAQARAITTMTVDWWRVAVCEEGGNWYYNGLSFVGGLGFRRSTWTYWAPLAGQPGAIPASGFYAPSVQIAVAEYMVHHGIAAPYFPGPGCTGYGGW